MTVGISIADYSGRQVRILRYFARRIHALGERALFELFLELVAAANLADRLPVYAAIDPTILAALRGVALPPAVRAIERAFE